MWRFTRNSPFVCSRWWEAPGGGSVQQRGGLSFRRRQEAPSGEEDSSFSLCFLHSCLVIIIHIVLTPGFEPTPLRSSDIWPPHSFSAKRRQFNCLNVNGCTHNVNTALNTVLLLFCPAVLSHIMRTSRVEVKVVSGQTATARATTKPTMHHTFPLRGFRSFSTLCLCDADGCDHINQAPHLHHH